MNEWITIWDLVLAPVYVAMIVSFAYFYQKKKRETEPCYKYFVPGLLAKIFGGISVCLIYAFYYKGGDTLGYFHDNICMVNLFLDSPASFFTVLFSHNSPETFSHFNSSTGWPWYWRDSSTFFVVRLSCLITLISFKTFIPTTIVLASLSFIGIWKLFKVFIKEFPLSIKSISVSFFFIPSVVFWGSGLLKDTIMLGLLGYLGYIFYSIIILKKQVFFSLVLLSIGLLIIMSIRPFMFITMILAFSMWVYQLNVNKIKSVFVRIITAPILFVFILSLCFYIMEFIGGNLGQYALDNILERAVVVQDDLKREYYGGHRFDIGAFEPTIQGVLSKAPVALNAALFRPYIWEAGNPVMFISAVENLMILSISIFILFKTKIVGLFKYIGNHYLLTFSIIFSLFFAFAVGLTTANFGALVRYKIPAVMLYFTGLLIINDLIKFGKKEDEIVE